MGEWANDITKQNDNYKIEGLSLMYYSFVWSLEGAAIRKRSAAIIFDCAERERFRSSPAITHFFCFGLSEIALDEVRGKGRACEIAATSAVIHPHGPIHS
jgi:hypothetical protein